MNWKSFLLSVAIAAGSAAIHAAASAVSTKRPALSGLVGAIESALSEVLVEVHGTTSTAS